MDVLKMFQVDLNMLLMQQILCLVEYIGEAPDCLSVILF